MLAPLSAQEVRQAPADTVASFPEAPAVAPQPPAPVVPPDFRVESTQVKRVDVVEAPEMPDLPPVEGTITLKVNTVADPGLPDPPPLPPPLPPLLPDDPQVRERLAALAAEHRETTVGFISATVYDGSRTLLHCYPSGGLDKQVTAWSNVDFNHFCGFATFEATGGDGDVRKYSLLMGIGSVNTERWRERAAEQGVDADVPEIPSLPDGAPSFVIETENPAPECVALIEDLHALYRAEGARMAEAFVAREQAREARKAYLLAHPPKPKDVTVNFWKRGNPAPATNGKEGGEP
jgi:hypothetical protein